MTDADDSSRPLVVRPDALQEAVQAAVSRNAALTGLQESTQELTGEVGGLRRALRRRPTRLEEEHRRRLVVLFALVWALVAIGVHDEHVERCSPGARLEPLAALVADGRFAAEELREAAREPVSPVCDVAFPWHSHTFGDVWPTPANGVGVALWLTGVGLVALWATGPRRGRDEDEPETMERGGA